MKVGTGMKGVSRKTIFPNEPTGRRVPSVSPGKRKPLPGLHLRHLVPASQVAGMQVYVTERTQKPPALRGIWAAAQVGRTGYITMWHPRPRGWRTAGYAPPRGPRSGR